MLSLGATRPSYQLFPLSGTVRHRITTAIAIPLQTSSRAAGSRPARGRIDRPPLSAHAGSKQYLPRSQTGFLPVTTPKAVIRKGRHVVHRGFALARFGARDR